MIGILHQYLEQNQSQLIYKIYHQEQSVKTESNLLDDEQTVLNNLAKYIDKLEKLYILVSDQFKEQHKNFFDEIDSKYNEKIVYLNNPSIKNYFKIETSTGQYTTQFLIILFEKIFHYNNNIVGKSPDERVDILFNIISTFNFDNILHPQNTTSDKLREFVEKHIPIIPDNDQYYALQQFYNFLNDPNPSIFILSGAAGTGKSTLIRYFIQLALHVYGKDLSYLLLAPTGKAARVIEEKTEIPAHTIHKSIYNFTVKITKLKDSSNDTDEYNVEESYEISEYQELRNLDHPIRLAIVDESSMLSDYETIDAVKIEKKQQERNNRFLINCTGFSLNDLVNFISQLNIPYKMVFVGDYCQLPPIYRFENQEIFPPALNYNHVSKKYAKIGNAQLTFYSANLSTAYRFGSEIIYLFSLFLRDRINQIIEKYQKKPHSYIDYSYNIESLIKQFYQIYANETLAVFNSLSDMISTYVVKYLESRSAIIITYRNKMAEMINMLVREKLNRKQLIENDDLLICTTNNYTYEIMNGDFLTVNKQSKIKCITTETYLLRYNLSVLLPFINTGIHCKDQSTNALLIFDSPISYIPQDALIDHVSHHSKSSYRNSTHNKEFSLYFSLHKLLKMNFIGRKKFAFANYIKNHIHYYLASSATYKDIYEKLPTEKQQDLSNFTPENSTLDKIHDLEKQYYGELIKKFESLLNLSTNKIIKIFQNEFYHYIIGELKTDHFLNAIKVKYGYAITCHKSQGSAWDYVFLTDLDQKDIRWLYTAVTRSVKNFYLTNAYNNFTHGNIFSIFFRILNYYSGSIKNIIHTFVIPSGELYEFINHYYLTDKDLKKYRQSVKNYESLDPEQDIIILQTINNFFILSPKKFLENGKISGAQLNNLLNKKIDNLQILW